MTLLYGDCYDLSNKVIILVDKTVKELNVSEEIRNELLYVNKYIEYSSTGSYNVYVNAYTIYTIIDRCVDENNNLILVCDYEYTKL